MVNLLSRERQVWEVGGICAYVSSNSQRRMDRSELGDVRSYIIVFLAFAVAATLVYTATVALIVVTKIYRHYVHRLTLYLAAAGLLHAVAIGLEVIPIDLSRPDNSTVSLRDNWGEACIAIGFVAQYLTILQALVIVWISFYMFVLVAFQKQLNRPQHEIGCLAVTISAPFLLTWEPFLHESYGQSGASCWIADGVGRNTSLGPIFKLTVNIVPIFIMSFGGLVMLLVASVILMRRGLRKDNFLVTQYRKALKEIVPLLVYPTIYFLIIFVRIIIVLASELNDPALNDVIFVSVLQSCSIALLLSLFMHGSVRHVVLTRPVAWCRSSRHYPLALPLARDEINAQGTETDTSVCYKSLDSVSQSILASGIDRIDEGSN